MVRFRFLLACLVMLALPLQGFAATTMLFCGMGPDHHATEVAAGAQRSIEHLHHAERLGDGVGSDASAQGHDAHHATATDSGEQAQHTDLVSSGHTCALCASCCHSVAIFETVPLASTTPLPAASFEDPPVFVQSRPALVPDKPPRA